MLQKIITRGVISFALLMSAPAMADYPIGVQDKYTVSAGSATQLHVLDNDIGENLRVTESNNWTRKGGRTRFIGNAFFTRRSVLYEPPSNFVGDDEFWYVFEDEQGRTNAAKVIVTVKAGNRFPDPQDDKVSVQTGKTITIDVMRNDGDEYQSAGRSSRISAFNDWSQKGGRIKQIFAEGNNPRGFLTYTPPSNGYVGTDEFWYVIKSNFGGLEHAAKVTINVTRGDSAGPYPVGKPDNLKYVPYSQEENKRSQYYPLDNDVGEGLRIVSRSGYKTEFTAWSEKGNLYSVSEGRKLELIPRRGFTGQDRIWYLIEDELGRTNFGVVTFQVD